VWPEVGRQYEISAYRYCTAGMYTKEKGKEESIGMVDTAFLVDRFRGVSLIVIGVFILVPAQCALIDLLVRDEAVAAQNQRNYH